MKSTVRDSRTHSRAERPSTKQNQAAHMSAKQAKQKHKLTLINMNNLHKEFVRLGRERNQITYKLLALLPKILEQKIYEREGYANIYDYAARIAGLSSGVVEKALKLEEKLQNMPHLQRTIETQGINKVGIVAGLATRENEEALAEKVEHMSKPALQEYSKEIRGKVTVGWQVELDQNMMFMFLKLKKKLGKNLSNKECLRKILEEMQEKSGQVTDEKPRSQRQAQEPVKIPTATAPPGTGFSAGQTGEKSGQVTGKKPKPHRQAQEPAKILTATAGSSTEEKSGQVTDEKSKRHRQAQEPVKIPGEKSGRITGEKAKRHRQASESAEIPTATAGSSTGEKSGQVTGKKPRSQRQAQEPVKIPGEKSGRITGEKAKRHRQASESAEIPTATAPPGTGFSAGQTGEKILPTERTGKVSELSEKKLKAPKRSRKVTRYISVHRKRKLSEQCSHQGCHRPAEVIHHPDRFSQNLNHENLKPLCKRHHEFAHNGISEPMRPVDYKYRKYRQAALV